MGEVTVNLEDAYGGGLDGFEGNQWDDLDGGRKRRRYDGGGMRGGGVWGGSKRGRGWSVGARGGGSSQRQVQRSVAEMEAEGEEEWTRDGMKPIRPARDTVTQDSLPKDIGRRIIYERDDDTSRDKFERIFALEKELLGLGDELPYADPVRATGYRRRRPVLGRGHVDADVMIVGEHPGREEMVQGSPFVGQTGRYLEKLVDVRFQGDASSRMFFTNAMTVATPFGGEPLARAFKAHKRFLKRLVDIVRPAVVIALGRRCANLFRCHFSVREMAACQARDLPADARLCNTISMQMLHGTIFQCYRFSEDYCIQVCALTNPGRLIGSSGYRRQPGEDYDPEGLKMGQARAIEQAVAAGPKTELGRWRKSFYVALSRVTARAEAIPEQVVYDYEAMLERTVRDLEREKSIPVPAPSHPEDEGAGGYDDDDDDRARLDLRRRALEVGVPRQLLDTEGFAWSTADEVLYKKRPNDREEMLEQAIAHASRVRASSGLADVQVDWVANEKETPESDRRLRALKVGIPHEVLETGGMARPDRPLDRLEDVWPEGVNPVFQATELDYEPTDNSFHLFGMAEGDGRKISVHCRVVGARFHFWCSMPSAWKADLQARGITDPSADKHTQASMDWLTGTVLECLRDEEAAATVGTRDGWAGRMDAEYAWRWLPWVERRRGDQILAVVRAVCGRKESDSVYLPDEPHDWHLRVDVERPEDVRKVIEIMRDTVWPRHFPEDCEWQEAGKSPPESYDRRFKVFQGDFTPDQQLCYYYRIWTSCWAEVVDRTKVRFVGPADRYVSEETGRWTANSVADVYIEVPVEAIEGRSSLTVGESFKNRSLILMDHGRPPPPLPPPPKPFAEMNDAEKALDALENAERKRWGSHAPCTVLVMDAEMYCKKLLKPVPHTTGVIAICAEVHYQDSKFRNNSAAFTNQYDAHGFVVGAAGDHDPDSVKAMSKVVKHRTLVTTSCFSCELEMLVAWVRFVRAVNPQVIVGHNHKPFDLRFIIDRMRILMAREAKRYHGPGVSEGARVVAWKTQGFSDHLVSLLTARCYVPSTSALADHWDRYELKSFSSKAFGSKVVTRIVMPGRSLMDTMELYMRERKEASYSLNFLASKYLGDTKNEVTYVAVPGLFEGGFFKLNKLRIYCHQDVALTARLFHLHKWTSTAMELTRITRAISISNVYVRGQQLRVVSVYMCRIFDKGQPLLLLSRGSLSKSSPPPESPTGRPLAHGILQPGVVPAYPPDPEDIRERPDRAEPDMAMDDWAYTRVREDDDGSDDERRAGEGEDNWLSDRVIASMEAALEAEWAEAMERAGEAFGHGDEGEYVSGSDEDPVLMEGGDRGGEGTERACDLSLPGDLDLPDTPAPDPVPEPVPAPPAPAAPVVRKQMGLLSFMVAPRLSTEQAVASLASAPPPTVRSRFNIKKNPDLVGKVASGDVQPPPPKLTPQEMVELTERRGKVVVDELDLLLGSNRRTKKVRTMREKLAQATRLRKKDVAPRYVGAAVLPLITGYLIADKHGRIFVLTDDFKSLYPSLHESYNVDHGCLIFDSDFDLLRYRGKITVDDCWFLHTFGTNPRTGKEERVYTVKAEFTRGGKAFGMGMIAEVCQLLVRLRRETQALQEKCPYGSLMYELLQFRQLGIKIVGNSTYGSCSVDSGMLARPIIGSIICAMGRFSLLEAQQAMRLEFGDQVLTRGGDTDSLFQHFYFIRSVFEAVDFGPISSMVGNRPFKRPLELDYEKCYDGCLLMAKKRYAGKTIADEQLDNFFSKKGWIEMFVPEAEWDAMFEKHSWELVKKIKDVEEFEGFREVKTPLKTDELLAKTIEEKAVANVPKPGDKDYDPKDVLLLGRVPLAKGRTLRLQLSSCEDDAVREWVLEKAPQPELFLERKSRFRSKMIGDSAALISKLKVRCRAKKPCVLGAGDAAETLVLKDWYHAGVNFAKGEWRERINAYWGRIKKTYNEMGFQKWRDEVLYRRRYELKDIDMRFVGTLTFKGTENVRRDACPYTKIMLNSLFRTLLFKRRPVQALMDFVEFARRMLRGEIPKHLLVCSKQFSRPLNAYASDQPHLAIVRRMKKQGKEEPALGSRVNFMVTVEPAPRKGEKRSGKVRKLSERAFTPQEVIERGKLLDYAYYYKNMLQKPAARLLRQVVKDVDLSGELDMDDSSKAKAAKASASAQTGRAVSLVAKRHQAKQRAWIEYLLDPKTLGMRHDSAKLDEDDDFLQARDRTGGEEGGEEERYVNRLRKCIICGSRDREMTCRACLTGMIETLTVTDEIDGGEKRILEPRSNPEIRDLLEAVDKEVSVLADDMESKLRVCRDCTSTTERDPDAIACDYASCPSFYPRVYAVQEYRTAAKEARWLEDTLRTGLSAGRESPVVRARNRGKHTVRHIELSYDEDEVEEEEMDEDYVPDPRYEGETFEEPVEREEEYYDDDNSNHHGICDRDHTYEDEPDYDPCVDLD